MLRFRHTVTATGPDEYELVCEMYDTRSGAIERKESYYLTGSEAKDLATSLEFETQGNDEAHDPDMAGDEAFHRAQGF